MDGRAVTMIARFALILAVGLRWPALPSTWKRSGPTSLAFTSSRCSDRRGAEPEDPSRAACATGALAIPRPVPRCCLIRAEPRLSQSRLRLMRRPLGRRRASLRLVRARESSGLDLVEEAAGDTITRVSGDSSSFWRPARKLKTCEMSSQRTASDLLTFLLLHLGQFGAYRRACKWLDAIKQMMAVATAIFVGRHVASISDWAASFPLCCTRPGNQIGPKLAWRPDLVIRRSHPVRRLKPDSHTLLARSYDALDGYSSRSRKWRLCRIRVGLMRIVQALRARGRRPVEPQSITGATTYTPSHPLVGATNDSFRLQGVAITARTFQIRGSGTLDLRSVDWAPRSLRASAAHHPTPRKAASRCCDSHGASSRASTGCLSR